MNALVLKNYLCIDKGDTMKTTDTLINALIKAQQEINHVVQDATNPFFKSDYATLKEVIDSVKKPLNDNGIYLQQESVEQEGGICVETKFYGHGGVMTTGKVYIPAVKNDPQAYGSAISYAKRYSLLLATGVATKKEDDDAEAAMRRNEPISKPSPRVATKPVEKAPVTNNKVKYEILDSEGFTKESFETIDDYLKRCRKIMGDPNNVLNKNVYDANKWKIKGYLKNGEAKESLTKLIALYEE